MEILYGDHDDDGEQTGENHRVDTPDDELRIVESGYVHVPCFRGQIPADDQKQGLVEVDEGKNLLAVARIAVEDFVGHDRVHVEAFDLESCLSKSISAGEERRLPIRWRTPRSADRRIARERHRENRWRRDTSRSEGDDDLARARRQGDLGRLASERTLEWRSGRSCDVNIRWTRRVLRNIEPNVSEKPPEKRKMRS